MIFPPPIKSWGKRYGTLRLSSNDVACYLDQTDRSSLHSWPPEVQFKAANGVEITKKWKHREICKRLIFFFPNFEGKKWTEQSGPAIQVKTMPGRCTQPRQAQNEMTQLNFERWSPQIQKLTTFFEKPTLKRLKVSYRIVTEKWRHSVSRG